MWLLNTKTARLEFFDGPDDKRLLGDGGYAILSHVWQKEPKEQTFQDIMALSSHTPASDDDTPRSRASPKIRDCCTLMASQGYRWVWIDTCCINKESSAELSEAINSMFEWYRRATVCYVYLFDVSVDDLEMGRRWSTFHKSKWFTRGWTLQELIAPRTVLFLLSDWTVLGAKTSLVDHLTARTFIDGDVLLHRRQLETVSISTRMSWASWRETTRVEDKAYSLMGIFGVNMPTIYGEGQAAFYRLQEEIMKISSDQTLFAWSLEPDHYLIHWERYKLNDLLSTIRSLPNRHVKPGLAASCLLASSPDCFRLADKFEPIRIADAMKAAEEACKKLVSLGLLWFEVKTTTPSPPETAAAKQRNSEFVVTSHGMRSTLPVIEYQEVLENEHDHGDDGDRNNETSTVDHPDHESRQYIRLSIGVLGCKDIRTGAVIGLVLNPLSSSHQLQHEGESHIYGTGCSVNNGFVGCRLVELDVPGDDTNPERTFVEPVLDAETPFPVRRHGYMTWATIHIIYRPLPHMLQTIGASMCENVRKYGMVVFLQFSRWSITQLAKHGFEVCSGFRDSLPLDTDVRLQQGNMKYSVIFTSDAVQGEAFTVILDRCICSMPDHETDIDYVSHRLRVDVTFAAERLSPAEPWVDRSSDGHGTTSTVTALDNCSLGHFHISESPNWTKKFGNTDRMVELTFNLYQALQRVDLYICVVDIKLAGDVYMSLRNETHLASDANIPPSY